MILLVPHDSNWEKIFTAEKIKLEKPLKPWLVAVEHIGSTAIPEIHAKPVVDIMIGVKSLASIDQSVIDLIENLNYQYIKLYEAEFPERRFFVRINTQGEREINLHLVEYNKLFWQEHLLFRDYLRKNPQDAKQYEYFKLELAKKFTDTGEYAKAKTDFVNEILCKAKLWSEK